MGDLFFFASRRRHTRFKCDWSSDVCSSDLERAMCSLDGLFAQLRLLANSPSRLHMARSRRLGEQFTSDQHATDFARACSNLIELGVAPQATRRILVDVAVAAKRLYRFSGHPGRLLGGVENCAGSVLAERAGMIRAVAGLADRIDIGPAGLPGGGHVGDLALHQLKLAYGLAELLAAVHIRNDDIHAGR